MGEWLVGRRMNEWMSADVNTCMQALTLEDTSGFFVVYSFQNNLGNPVHQKLQGSWYVGRLWELNPSVWDQLLDLRSESCPGSCHAGAVG